VSSPWIVCYRTTDNSPPPVSPSQIDATCQDGKGLDLVDVAASITDLLSSIGTKSRKSTIDALPIPTGSGHRDGRREGPHGQTPAYGVVRVELEGLRKVERGDHEGDFEKGFKDPGWYVRSVLVRVYC
jgi:hypothetical protein